MTQETDVKIIDKNGEEFTDTDMGYLNVSKVYVTAKLWKVQSNVRISAEYSGTPAAGYQVESIMTTPNVISIAGSEDALAALKEDKPTSKETPYEPMPENVEEIVAQAKGAH